MSKAVVIDANRLFSWLIANHQTLRRTMRDRPDLRFYCPKYVLVELFKHKERIAVTSGLEEAELLAMLQNCLERIHFYDEDAISLGCWTEAWRLCRDVDENDVAYVALTLELEGELWSSDRILEMGITQEGIHPLFP